MAAIVLGFDGSPSSRSALEVAIEQAKTFDETLIVVFAGEPPGRQAGEEFREHRRVLEEIGQRLLAEATERAEAAGVRVEARIVDRKASVALESVARELGARLIVVGTYGEGPLRSAILGSTPHKLLHLSRIPVLCVPESGKPS